MKIVMDRSYCDASLPFCARCSATFFRKPLSTDRPCIVEVIDDGDAEHLQFVIKSEGHTLMFTLADELQEGLALEGWEFLADFEPALFRKGAAERWRELGRLPIVHKVQGETL